MNMYKQRVKSKINPLLATAVWFAWTYIFILLWGIAQIIFEFNLEIIKHIICLAGTGVFAWFLISKLLTELEFEVSGGKLTVKRILSKRSSDLKIVALTNIIAICESKDKYRKYDVKKCKSLTRPGQEGKNVYVVYKDGAELCALRLKAEKELLSVLRKGNKEK